MSDTRKPTGNLEVALLLVAALTVYLVYSASTGIVAEDALITYRYVINFISGNGLVFTAGERVLGTTTPLYALVLAMPAALFGPQSLPTISSVLMAAGLAGGAFAAQRGLGLLGVSLETRLLSMTLMLFNPRALIHTLGGMEMGLVVLLMGLSFLSLVRQRDTIAGVWAGLLLLTRVDGVVWFSLLLCAMWWRSRRVPWAPAATSLLVVAPWCIVSTLYYGSFVPHSLLAKLVIPLHREGRLDVLVAGLGPAFERTFETLIYPLSLHPVLGIAAMLFVVFGIVALRRAGRVELWLFPGYVFAFNFFLFIGNAPNMRWYLVPIYWSAAPFLAIGIGRFCDAISAWARGRGRPWLGRLAHWCSVGGTVALLGAALASGFRFATTAQDSEQTRVSTGLWLAEHASRGATVAAEDVGYLGYFSHLPIVDLAGLNSPAVLAIARGSTTNGEMFRRVVREIKPDYIVLRSYEVATNRLFLGGKAFETVAEKDEFLNEYVEAQRFNIEPCDTWRADYCKIIWARRR